MTVVINANRLSGVLNFTDVQNESQQVRTNIVAFS